MKKTSNPGPGRSRLARRLRTWARKHRRTVQMQMVRGASYSLGSSAISLLIVWFQGRH
ncbi:hypothetical protein [Streptomyces sp. NPDC016845]|uniref:hypothetical protein n=1 Tax=Streptomyces sp. NPDC016845 TaxID=3364972 RepID=UPI00379D5351